MTIKFTKATVNSNLANPTGIMFLDLNKDNLPDIVAVSSGFNEDDLVWHRSNSNSTINTSHTLINGELGGGRNGFYGADIDRDGDIDLVSAENDDDDVTIWYNTNGQGTSWSGSKISDAFQGATDLYIGDFGTDGWVDIIGASEDDDDVSIWRQTSGGSFAGELTIDGGLGEARAIDGGDINRDGRLDVVAGGEEGLFWYRNDGSGTSWTGYNISGSSYQPQDLKVADIDRDNDLDVIVAADNGVYYWKNNGSGSFSGATQVANFKVAQIAVADIDRDGDNDLIFGNYSSNASIYWYSNNGSGGFTPYTIDSSGLNNINAVGVGDANNDGFIDIGIGTDGEDDIYWYRNELRKISITANSNPVPVEGGDYGSFTISLDESAIASITLSSTYTISGTATNNTDYTISGYTTIPAGSTSAIIYINPINDLNYDPNETITLTLTGNGINNGYVIDSSKSSATLTISDPTPVVSISSSGVVNPSESGIIGQFVISLNTTATSNFSLGYSLSGASNDIILDNDTNPNNGSLGSTIPIGIGESSKTIYVFAKDDFTYEANESFTFTLLPTTPKVNNIALGTGYRVDLSKNSRTLNIIDDEPIVTVTGVKNLQEGSDTGEFIGYVDIILDRAVTKQPGLSVYYNITGGSATQFTDYFNSQGRLTSGSNAQNVVFIPNGADSARLYLSALPDAIAEATETITISLINDQNPNTTPDYAVGNNYALGNTITATVNITDSGYYNPNIAILDRAGNAVTNTNPLEANSEGKVNFSVKLTSQPTQNVTVRVDTFTLTFTSTNWDTPQNISLNGITSTRNLTITSTSNDSNYNNRTSNITINPHDGIPNLDVTEGENSLPTIIPSVTILLENDTNEGSELAGVFKLLLSNPAPSGGLVINYMVTGTTTPNVDYNTLLGSIEIPEGETSVFLNVPVIDDKVKENAETVIVTLQAGEDYTVNNATSSATLTITDDDESSIEFATPQTTASITSSNDLLTVSVVSFNDNSGTFTVNLNQQPSQNVTVTLRDSLNNNATGGSLTFTPDNWQSPQNLTLNNLTANNSDDFNYQVTAVTESQDSNYQNKTLNFPIVTNTLNTTITSVLTTEGEEDILLVKLTSQPSGNVTLSFSQIDATENSFSTNTLTFAPDNWNSYQSINVSGLKDDRADGDITYNVKVTATSSDSNYNGVYQLLPITNTDIDSDVVNNEPEEDDNLETDPLVTINIQGSSEIGESDATGGKFRISVGEGSSSEPVKVRYSILTNPSDNNATEGLDYQSFNLFEQQLGTENPFNGLDIGSYSAPFVIDLDQDRDLDLFIGNYEGSIVYYENTGTNNQPTFLKNTSNNPFSAIDLNGATSPGYSTPAFGDVDGDGDHEVALRDQDLILGSSDGKIRFYRNSNLTFTEVTGSNNPFNSIDIGDYSTPILIDIDSDSDLDLFIGSGDGLIKFYRNTGSETNPVFVEETAENPFQNVDLFDRASIIFADLDEDGDLDAVLTGDTNGATKSGGVMEYWLNIGTPSQPNFIQDDSLFERSDFTIPDNVRPIFGDINGDLDQDLLFGNIDGIIDYYENLSSGEITIIPGQFADIDLTPFADNIAEGDENVTVVLNTNQGYYIDSENTTVTFTIKDDDIAGVSITDNNGNSITSKIYTSSEADNSPQTFKVKLTSQPTDNVIVYLGTNNKNEGILSAEFQENQEVISFYFTPDNWNIEQSFTVNPQDDLRDDEIVAYQIISTVKSGDDFYNNLEVSDISLNNQDNDNAGINIVQISDNSTEGSSNSYQISLKTQPLSPVNVTMTPSNEEIKFSNQGFSQPLTLTFNEDNWNIPQTVTVFAVDDSKIEYNHSTNIDFSIESKDNRYSSLTPPQPIEVNIIDNDFPLATLPVTQNATEEAMPGYFTISVSEAVNSAFGETGLNVAYRVLGSSSAVNGFDYQTVLETGSVRIAPGETSTTLTISSIDNFIDDGDKQVVIELLAGDGYSLGETTTNTLVIINNDKAGVQIIQSGIVPVVKEGESYTFYVSLLSEPTQTTTINFSDNPNELNNINPLTFTSENWYIPQNVTISAIDENIAETGENHTTQLAFIFDGASEYENLDEPVNLEVNIIDRTFNSVNTALGLQYSLNSIEKAFTESSLPLIGSASTLPIFFDEITDKIVSEIYTTNNLTAWKLEQIFRNLLPETLGDSLSNLQINYIPNNNDTPFTISFTVTYNNQTIPLSKDLAIPSLDLTVNGEAQADIIYDFNLGFGINKTGGYYLNTSQTFLNPDIKFDNVTPTGIDSINGLTVDFADEGIDLDLDYDIKLLGNNLDTDALNILKNRPAQELFANFDYDFKTGSFAKLLLSATPDEKITDLFPGITFDLAVEELPLYNYADESKISLNDFVVTLQNVALDVQSLIRGYVKKYVDLIDEILQPIYPIIDTLNADTKFLSALELDFLFDSNNDGKVSVMELVFALLNVNDDSGDNDALQNLGFDGFDDGDSLDFYEFIDAINELIEVVRLVDDYIADDTNVLIDIGSVSTSVQNGEVDFSRDDLTIPDGNILDRIANNPLATDDLEKLIDSILSLDGFEIPLLTDFFSVAGLLLGEENVDFLIYDVPDLDFDISVDLSDIGLDAILPEYGLDAVLEIALGLNSNLYLAYDAYGLNQWQETGFDEDKLNLLLDGLYIRDVDENDKDVNELGASFGVDIGMEFNAIVAKARMTGGVQSDNDVKLDFVDGGEYQGLGDGIIRYSELSPLFTGDLSVLEISGAIEAFLNTKVQVGVDVGLFEIMETILDIDIFTYKIWDIEDVLKKLGISGFASQSYLQGGTVFFDVNFNGQLDQGEISTVSNDDGSFNLPVDLVPFDLDRNGIIDDQDGRLVVIDGVDSATGLPISTPLFATVDSSMITPLTSLVQKIHQSGIDIELAEAKIKEIFALPESLDLSQFDPMSALENGDINGKKVYTSHVITQGTIAVLTQFISGITNQTPAQVADQVIGSIALSLYNEDTGNFNNLSFLENLITTLINDVGGEFSDSELTDITDVLTRILTIGTQLIAITGENSTVDDVVINLNSLKIALQFDLGNILGELGAGLITPATVDDLLHNWQGRMQESASVPNLFALVLALQTEKIPQDIATEKVLTTFELPEDFDLTKTPLSPTDDPILSQQVLILENQLTLLYQLGGQVLQSAGITDSHEAQWLISRATSEYIYHNPDIDLTDSETINQIIDSAISFSTLTVEDSIIETKLDRITSVNTTLEIINQGSNNYEEVANQQQQILDSVLEYPSPYHYPLPLVVNQNEEETLYTPQVIDTKFQISALNLSGEYELGIKTPDGKSIILLENLPGSDDSSLTNTLDEITIDTLMASETKFFGSLINSPEGLSAFTDNGLELYLTINGETYSSQNSEQLEITSKGSQGFALTFKDDNNTVAEFALNTPVFLTQGFDSSENTTVNLTIARSTANENTIGIYPVDDLTGAIIMNDRTIMPHDPDYDKVAVERAQSSGLIFETPENMSIDDYTLALPNASIFGFFLLVNGNVEEYLNQSENLIKSFFSYGEANQDKRQHFTSVGNNIYGFEDTFGGGDNDFNDILIQIVNANNQ
ncbi:FG-GAP-like repeat-containing protein [Geminocystis sp. NIES-3709]|uniref:FG-GAP-like repeat-containing protein n=1 Tax=Geminocystis sp. NIES-3709 TaxID=1617448 RepID=UPI0005FC4313|nr:FG-GAP-like repeat-containing protein [Geminocystis sp. NIES-3709]BAQ65142.1 flagellar hook-length control protein FliK [Geminocystis sp. NIES-3709]